GAARWGYGQRTHRRPVLIPGEPHPQRGRFPIDTVSSRPHLKLPEDPLSSPDTATGPIASHRLPPGMQETYERDPPATIQCQRRNTLSRRPYDQNPP
ncbi:MAG TPA: hypothetical protein PK336_08565, partial [Methanoculleus sp.]|nr:hypothetical protein [Methanoculleus sp.]